MMTIMEWRAQLRTIMKEISLYTDNMDIDEEENNVNNESSIFNLINSLERASNLNNRNYYNSITEDPEIQQAILMSFTN